MSSLRERLNSAPAFTSETVEAWGEKIEVRSMTLGEKSAITELATQDGDLAVKILLPRVIIATCFDPETGGKLFTDADEEWLCGQPAGVVEDLAQTGIRVSGIGGDALSEGKDGS